MNFDPQKFFIGLMEFFSILLPGALLTYLLMDMAGPVVLGDRYCRLEGAEAWAVFLFASYLFGHLVFLMSSWLDEFYDRDRALTLNKQIARLARSGELLPWRTRAATWLVFKGESDLAVERAGRIKKQALGALQAEKAINTFQWCKALLNVESPASLAVVQRFEADSKFFRCFAVVLLLLLLTWPLHHDWPYKAIPLVLMLFALALWRYMEQRHKATNQAYWSVITLTAKNGKVAFDKPERPVDSPDRAGGIVCRNKNGLTEFLLVDRTDDPERWELPAGHIRLDPVEDPREAAVRGVYELTGVWARIRGDLGLLTYVEDGSPIRMRVYLMEHLGNGWRANKDRQACWLSREQTRDREIRPEIRELLERAAASCIQGDGAKLSAGT